MGSVYNATCWGGSIFSPLVSRKLLDGSAKFKRRSKALPISLTSELPMTSQVRSKITYFAGHGSSRECAITSSKTHFIENQRQGVSCLVHMWLLEITDNTTSGHRSGHQGSAHEPNFTRAVWCMFYGQFFISNSMVLVIRTSGTVYVTSWWRSGQRQVKKGQILSWYLCIKWASKRCSSSRRF